MIDLLLFPSSYFSTYRVDEDLQQEFDAASATGLFHIIFFNYDKWFREGELVLSDTPITPCTAVMRGWMMKPEQYSLFYQELENHNIRLITKPDEYTLMHSFPNIYKTFGTDTARMEIFPLHKQIDVEEVKKSFRRFMIKDYVKSVKGTEFPRFFDASVTQKEFDEWMEIFYKYRGNLLTGGICVKEFLDLRFYGDKTNEYRVFYISNEIATVSRNSNQKIYTQEPPKGLLEKYKNLASHYYTIDFAELADGSWKIIEAGDGSVSGLSPNQNIEQYFRALYQAFME
jgi:hypothetical protein